MSKTRRPNYRRGSRGRRKAERHITVRGVRREPPDLRKLSRAVIAMAMREAEAEAEAKAAMKDAELPKPKDDKDSSEAEDPEVRP